MKKCIHAGCSGRPEWEHAFIYAGRQINERWSIVPVCAFHHRGSGLVKGFNQYVALTRASDDDLKKYPRVDWENVKKHLTKKYAKYPQ